MRDLLPREERAGPLGYYRLLTFEHAAALHSAARDCQEGLDESLFAITPDDGLHLTLDRITRDGGSTSEQRARIAEVAVHACARQSPFALTIRQLTNMRGTIAIIVEPSNRVTALRDGLRAATSSILPDAAVRNTTSAPHVTIAYPIYEELTTEAAAAAEAADTRLDHVSVSVSEVGMVALERHGHEYRWETIARIPLTGP
ncbi:2'-5' RNA ligase family protein [Nocardia higoensis]|uniref:2'-5' RNA ligase family protein n=1 Tax=Nocardia higoensis TaxID=228599 RepID=A0ABS0DHG0_9NOCA|nr:2'-5' RNA ligase family protein [Nocardia higoensis]MBF6357906.1 2'-5' RNA ligase family protein [Nocardia higoensis]